MTGQPALAKPARLNDQHDTLRFSCGDDVLDGWLRHRASAQRDEGTSTFVVAQGSRVVGYYSLARGAVERRIHVPRWRSRRTTVDPVPTLVVGRLAVDSNFQGQGVGARMLRDALMRAATVYRTVGLPLILAHAIEDDRKNFYRHFGFSDTRLDPYLLALPLRDAAIRPGTAPGH